MDSHLDQALGYAPNSASPPMAGHRLAPAGRRAAAAPLEHAVVLPDLAGLSLLGLQSGLGDDALSGGFPPMDTLRKAEELLLSADVPMRSPVWIMSPRSRLFLRDLRDTEDRGVFGDEMRQSGTINGRRFFETNNIANNLGGGSDESLVILVDASEVVIGDVQQVSVDRTNTATVQIDGVDTSLFEHDMSAIRLRQWNDLILRHDVSASVIEAVRWGS